MLKIDVSGLDKLKNELDAAQRAFSALDGGIGTVSFNTAKPTECTGGNSGDGSSGGPQDRTTSR